MPLKWKTDVLQKLKEKGYSTYMIRKEKLLAESSLQKLRKGAGLSWEVLETLCRLLKCQPGDLLEYVQEDEPGGSSGLSAGGKEGE